MKLKPILMAALAFVCVAAALDSCKKSDTAATTVSAGTCDSTLTYSSSVSPLISSYCVSCHGQFSVYANVYADKSNIYTYVSSGSMPRGTSLSAAQRTAILCWVSLGAKNN